MARVKIPIAVIDPNGTAVQGASVAVKKRSDGSNAVLFQAETGPTTVTNPTPTDAVGRVQAWVDRGSYNAIISGTGITTYTQAFEGAPAADRSVDSIWLPVGVDAPLLGALPSSPVDGQRIYYLADASNGIIWTLRYRAYALDGVTVNSSPYKWEVLGSPSALRSEPVTTAVNAATTAGGWAAFVTTPDTAVVLPLAGDYEVTFGAGIRNASSANSVDASIGVSVNNADPTLRSLEARVGATDLAAGSTTSRVGTLIGMAAGASVSLRYKSNSLNVTIHDPFKFIRPIRVG